MGGRNNLVIAAEDSNYVASCRVVGIHTAFEAFSSCFGIAYFRCHQNRIGHNSFELMILGSGYQFMNDSGVEDFDHFHCYWCG